MNSNTVVIVGAGQAGCAVALRLRKYGHSGRIVLFGDERALPYERPPLSKAFLASGDAPLSPIAAASDWEAANIEMHLGERVERLDTQARRIATSGGQYAYDCLVLATGSRANRLAAGIGSGAHYLRTEQDARAIRSAGARSAVALGAGVIGMELASTLAAGGATVTVVAPEAWPMARILPEPAARYLAGLHDAAGVRMAFGESLASLSKGAASMRVGLASGRVVEADIVVAGIGVRPDIALAQEAGIATGRGILTDAFGQTSAEGVFAAGEVAQWFHPYYGAQVVFENWTHAIAHGDLVAKVISGEAAQPYEELPWMWSDQLGHNIQVLGQLEPGLEWVVRDYGGGQKVWFGVDAVRGVRMVAAFNRGRDIRPCKRLCQESRLLDLAALADPAVELRLL
jgi:3-phenylpropionate/trans-cinnamate dioxygenase ferredoxin reductase subunit